MGLIIIIFIAYLIFFPIKTLKENDVITQIEPSLYNTIILYEFCEEILSIIDSSVTAKNGI